MTKKNEKEKKIAEEKETNADEFINNVEENVISDLVRWISRIIDSLIDSCGLKKL